MGYARPTLLLGRPRWTFVLLAANVLLFAATKVASGSIGSVDSVVLQRFGANVNVLIAEGQAWRLFTAMFLHVSEMHLLFNAYALLVLGTEVERLYGGARFLSIYLLAGLWGGLLSFAFGTALSAGASGAIFGLLGAMVAFFLRQRELFGTWGRQRLLNLLGVAALNLVLGFTMPHIDNLAHVGGLVSGTVIGWLLAPRYAVDWDQRLGLHLVDRTSRLVRWGIVVLVAIVWAGCTFAAISVQPQSAASLINQGRQALRSQELGSAEAIFREATGRDPTSVEAHFYLGVVLSQQGKLEDAIQAYRAALRLEPNLAEAHWNLGLIYAHLKRFNEAIAEFQRFIELNPNAPDAAQARRYVQQMQSLLP